MDPIFGLLLIAAGNGLQVVLLGTRAPEAGFSNITTGIVMSVILPVFLQVLLSSHAGPCGACSFLVQSAIASAAVLIHIVLLDPSAWTRC